MYEASALTSVALAELAVAAREVGRIEPPAEEVRPEVQDVPCVRDVKVRNRLLAEGAAHGFPQNGVAAQGIEAQQPGPGAFRKGSGNVGDAPSERVRGEQNAVGRGALQHLCETIDAFCPVDTTERPALGDTQQRMLDPIRVVQRLQQ